MVRISFRHMTPQFVVDGTCQSLGCDITDSLFGGLARVILSPNGVISAGIVVNLAYV